MMQANDLAHSLRPGAECLMAQEAADVLGYLVKGHIRYNETITGMSQRRLVEAMIAGEESRLGQLVEQRNDFVAVFHAQPPDLGSDLPHSDAPGKQTLFFFQADVFIQNKHQEFRPSF
jgi:hypothetical protein